MTNKKKTLSEQGVLNRRAAKVTDPVFRENPFFDPEDLVQVKYEMVRRVMYEGKSISEAAKSFGLSRPTFYQAEEALRREGLLGLAPQKSGPRSRHKLTDEVMNFIADKLAEDPSIVMSDLVENVNTQFSISVHPRSIERALNSQKKIPTNSSRKRRESS